MNTKFDSVKLSISQIADYGILRAEAVLKLLASQAAICLENTRLYRDLEEREAKIRRLVDANVMGIFIWDCAGEITEANEAFLHMLQYSREDLVSGRMRWTDLTPAEWRDQDNRAVIELKATGAIQPYEKEYFRKDGSRVPVLIGGAMFEGNRSEGVAFVLDLSEQKRAENALLASEERWSRLAENSSAGIALIASDGRFIAANQALQKMLGYTEDELHGRTLLDITHEEDRAATEARIAEAQESQRRVYRLDQRFLRKDGSIMWADISSVFVLASGSNPSYFSVVIVDRTEHQRAEEALHKAQAELAHITRVATMGELTASIAHEVNQPLGAIANNAAACVRWLEAQEYERARQSASRVIAEGHRACQIIGRIRALAKKAPLQQDWLDVNEVVREVIAMAQGELKQNGVVLQTKLASDLPVIMGDRIQLQQVLLNLLINAVEAMSGTHPGQRKILVSSRQVTAVAGQPGEGTIPHEILTEPEGNGVLVSLADSGPGVDPETVDQLFDAFYTTKAQGLGMGLAISRSILEAHGGRLWVTANTPKGAVFNFILPIGDEL